VSAAVSGVVGVVGAVRAFAQSDAGPPIKTPPIAWHALAPMLILIAGAVLLLGTSAMSRRRSIPGVYALATVVIAFFAMFAAVPLWREVTDPARGPYTAISGAVAVDGFSVFFTFVICVAVVLAAMLADGYLRREKLDGAELYVLILLSASGGVIMSSANDLIVMFLGLEILSIAAYVLAAMHLRRAESQEAGMKYFVLGAFSSAFFLYGIALVYGSTGSTNLGRIAAFANPIGPAPGTVDPKLLAGGTPALLLAGLALLLVGFGFKIAAVPFHSWTPDVYQGSPTPVVAYMASAVKAAAFAGLLRVFVVAFADNKIDWQPYMYALAVATLLVGAVLAVVQTDVKRMLAYSSINHAGFILIGVQAGTAEGTSGALFYLAAYTFMVIGSFGVVSLVARRGDARTSLDDFKGLSRPEPVLAFVFAIFLLGQAGVPLTSGFFAKFYVLEASVNAHSWPLAITAMLSAVIAAYLYLRIVVSMYMSESEEEMEEIAEAPPVPRSTLAGYIRIPFAAGLALFVAFAATIGFGFFPTPLANSSRDAVPTVSAPPK
jgi:NADH-quinone oxidoreductase subunit N